MHMRPMPETAGRFGATKTAACSCPKCDGGPVTYEIWESSCGGYEDEKYTCGACRYVWWVEGPDS